MRRGGCLCGAVRYEVEGEPLRAGLCHCRSCRKAASAPALPFAVFPAGAFRFTQGTPVDYGSSPHVTRSFCGRCGSPLTYRTEDAPGHVDVMAGSLDEPEGVPPQYHVWAGEKLGWGAMCDGLPAYRTTREAGELV